MTDQRFLRLEEAAKYMGCTTRWVRRHWPEMVRSGARIHRVPINALKGRLIFEKTSLDAYMEACRIRPGKSPL